MYCCGGELHDGIVVSLLEVCGWMSSLTNTTHHQLLEIGFWLLTLSCLGISSGMTPLHFSIKYVHLAFIWIEQAFTVVYYFLSFFSPNHLLNYEQEARRAAERAYEVAKVDERVKRTIATANKAANAARVAAVKAVQKQIHQHDNDDGTSPSRLV